MAPAMRAQDIVKDTEKGVDKTADVTKDTSKDVAHGTKKAATKTADVTKDTSKDVAHGTTMAAKKTGHAVKTGADKTANAVKQQARTSAEVVRPRCWEWRRIPTHSKTAENRECVEWERSTGLVTGSPGVKGKKWPPNPGMRTDTRCVKRSTSFSALSVFFWPVPFFHVGVRRSSAVSLDHRRAPGNRGTAIHDRSVRCDLRPGSQKSSQQQWQICGLYPYRRFGNP